MEILSYEHILEARSPKWRSQLNFVKALNIGSDGAVCKPVAIFNDRGRLSQRATCHLSWGCVVALVGVIWHRQEQVLQNRF